MWAVSGPGFIFLSQPRHPLCWLNGGTFFAFGGEDWVASVSSSLLGQFLLAGQAEPWGRGDRAESGGLLSASPRSDSKGATPPLVGGVAAWSLAMQGCLWVALCQRGSGPWETGGHTLRLTYCCVPRAGPSPHPGGNGRGTRGLPLIPALGLDSSGGPAAPPSTAH